LKRSEKEQTVAQLVGVLNSAKAVFFTDFKGLKVDELSDLRRKIGGTGAKYQVAKNTLIKLAAQGTAVEQVTDLLVGNNALSTTDSDPVPLAKVLVEFAKANEKLVVKGGVLESQPVTPIQIKAIADLPSREVLLATMLGTMNAVPTGFVRVLAAMPQGLVTALSAIRDQKESAGE
jgi:large subunit ribosomal protein L10